MVLQRRHFITFLLVLLITGIALAYNPSAADQGLYPLEDGSDHSLLKCSDRLRGRVESESAKNPISVWIFFADRERERLILRESPDIIS
ncbi:MAG: hypothetical protein KAX13_08545, partial [Candidatus Krumholzibacteria bacterium]|nr:hypothetical protein [Candidatus Krumholzibacteria bacterium]